MNMIERGRQFVESLRRLARNVSSNVRQLGAVINEHIRLFCGYCGLLIQTSVGNGGGLGSPRTKRSGCAA